MHMTPSAAAMNDFESGSTNGVRAASGERLPVAGHGSVNVMFRSDGNFTDVTLTNDPRLRFNLFPLMVINKKGHAFHGLPRGRITYFD